MQGMSVQSPWQEGETLGRGVEQGEREREIGKEKGNQRVDGREGERVCHRGNSREGQ